MRAIYLVSVCFTISLAAASVTMRSSFAQAAAQAATPAEAEECLSKPGATAPQGSHWFYRIKRPDGRRCWYLGAEGARGRATTARTTPKPIRHRTAVQTDDASAAQIASAGVASDQDASAPPARISADAAPAPAATADASAPRN